MLCLALCAAGLLAQAGQVNHSSTAGRGPSGTTCAPTNTPIAWSDLGAKATAQYSGDGLSVAVTPQGAVRLHCAFQKLEGEVTPEGLWLSSTVPGGAIAGGAATVPGSRFRVVADAVGREGGTVTALPRSGTASGDTSRARFARPGVVEEYSVSVDGVRQDFVVSQPPAGPGDLCVELALSGARAETAAGGAQLVLDGSGRKLAYSRLHVVDATGRQLAARIEVPAPDRLAVLVADAQAVYPVRIDPTFSDADWSALGSGVNGDVYAMAVSDTNLYAGGDFRFATNGASTAVRANYIAKWDGTQWSALGSGLNNTVRALAVSGTNLYAGGGFTYATNGTSTAVSANHIAKWNGTEWSALGSGVNNTLVHALAVSGTNLYAGGDFNYATNGTSTAVRANYIAKWDGTQWSALGSGVNNTLRALAVSGTNLYAGGDFTYVTNGTSTAVRANRIAKWNGTQWSALGSGVNGSVEALAVSGTNLYVGGEFQYATNSTSTAVRANRIAKWDGTQWSALGSGMDSTVSALAVSGTNLYAGGDFNYATNSTSPVVTANKIAKWEHPVVGT